MIHGPHSVIIELILIPIGVIICPCQVNSYWCFFLIFISLPSPEGVSAHQALPWYCMDYTRGAFFLPKVSKYPKGQLPWCTTSSSGTNNTTCDSSWQFKERMEMWVKRSHRLCICWVLFYGFLTKKYPADFFSFTEVNRIKFTFIQGVSWDGWTVAHIAKWSPHSI